MADSILCTVGKPFWKCSSFSDASLLRPFSCLGTLQFIEASVLFDESKAAVAWPLLFLAHVHLNILIVETGRSSHL